jgi:phage/plasmid-like protein (TIGR03299 family)
VADVNRRLFDFTVDAAPLYVRNPDGTYVEVADRKAQRASDNGDVLGIFSDGYRGHDYSEWLIGNVASILDDDLGIGSAGLLKSRGQAWVSVEVPENVTTPEGVTFRPNLLAATSFDGSLATTYNRCVTNTVCDNTLTAGLSEDGGKFRLKHTRYSQLRIADAREALSIVYGIADDFATEVAALCATPVSDKVWAAVLDKLSPIPNEAGRGRTTAEHRRDELVRLYTHDDRVAPWSHTAYGVLQAFNTYAHHYAGTRGQSLTQRNRSAALTGTIAAKDALVLSVVAALIGA